MLFSWIKCHLNGGKPTARKTEQSKSSCQTDTFEICLIYDYALSKYMFIQMNMALGKNGSCSLICLHNVLFDQNTGGTRLRTQLGFQTIMLMELQ